MQQADALKKWKKDKPLLLTDTGVSDVLRKLPSDWFALIDTTAVTATLKELKTMMADPKISQSKSATASLTAIRKSVKEELATVTQNRARGIELFKAIHDDAKDILEMCESKKISLAKLKAYPGSISKPQKEMDQLCFRGRDGSAIPLKVMREFREAMDSTVKVAASMVELVEDGMSEKPKRDLKAEFPGLTKKFKTAKDEMPSAWAAVERLP